MNIDGNCYANVAHSRTPNGRDIIAVRVVVLSAVEILLTHWAAAA